MRCIWQQQSTLLALCHICTSHSCCWTLLLQQPYEEWPYFSNTVCILCVQELINRSQKLVLGVAKEIGIFPRLILCAEKNRICSINLLWTIHPAELNSSKNIRSLTPSQESSRDHLSNISTPCFLDPPEKSRRLVLQDVELNSVFSII